MSNELIKRGDLRNLALLIGELERARNRDVYRVAHSDAKSDADIVKARALVKRLREAMAAGLDNVYWGHASITAVGKR